MEYEKVHFGVSTYEEDESLGAANNSEFMAYVLALFSKPVSNLAALIGDNCASKNAFYLRIGCGCIGCSNHRFIFAVNNLLASSQDTSVKMQILMGKRRFRIYAGKLRSLRKFCSFTPLKENGPSKLDGAMIIRCYGGFKKPVSLLRK